MVRKRKCVCLNPQPVYNAPAAIAPLEKRGWTLLHEAAYDNAVDKIQYLLDGDATVIHGRTTDGETAFEIAAEHGKTEAFLMLFKFKPDMLLTDNYCILFTAIQYNRLEIVNVILTYIVETASKKDWASQMALGIAAQHGHVQIVHLLLRYLPTNYKTSHGSTVLHTAIMNNQLNLVKYLLTVCPQEVIFATNELCFNALYLSMSYGSLAMTKHIVETCPEFLSIECCDHELPFKTAIWVHNLEVVNYFISEHPAHAILYFDGHTALHMAPCVHLAQRLYVLDPTMIDALTLDGATPLYTAINKNDVPLVKFLLACKPSALSCPNMHGFTPLQSALENKAYDAINYVLTQAPELVSTGRDGNTVLHIAARCLDDPSAFQRLLEYHSTDLNTTNKQMATPFHIALDCSNQCAIRAFKCHAPVDTLYTLRSYANMLQVASMYVSFCRQCDVLDTLLLPDLYGLINDYIGLPKHYFHNFVHKRKQ